MRRINFARRGESKQLLPLLAILTGTTVVVISFLMDFFGVGGPSGYGYTEFGIALAGTLVMCIGIVWLSPVCQHALQLLVFRHTPAARRLVFLLPVAITVGASLLYFFSPLDYHFISDEDRYVENATALVYFVAFPTALCVGWRIRSAHPLVSVMYYGLALGLLFVGMEEISWGQRLLGFQTPEFVKERNVQGELTLHNLRAFQTNFDDKSLFSSLTLKLLFLVGLYGSFLWFVIPGAIKSKHESVVSLLAPRPVLIFYFLPIVFVHALFLWSPEGIGSYVPRNSEAEFAELILSLGFLLFVLGNLGQYWNGQKEVDPGNWTVA